jgi:hypothetical protein
MEIRTKEADPHQRLRAIEAQRKVREKELAERGADEFTSELGSFVQGRKLKKTGGHEEVERVRAKKSEKTLKKMLTGDTGGEGGVLSPQLTGASMLSAQMTGTSVISPQMTGTSTTFLTAQMTGGSVVSPQLTGEHRLSGSSGTGGSASASAVDLPAKRDSTE